VSTETEQVVAEVEKTAEPAPTAPVPSLAPELQALKDFFVKELAELKKPTPEPVVDQKPVVEDLTKKVASLEKERDEALKKAEQTMQVAVLIQNGLRSPRFASQILQEYDGKTPFEQYVTSAKKDPELSILFNSGNIPSAPKAPTGGNPASAGSSKTIEDQLREKAERLMPNNKDLQEAFVRRSLAQEKK
jgi:hypothetical protein